MRVFIGIELPEVWRNAVEAGRSTMLELDPGWSKEKWVPAENLHMTLKFMGDVDAEAALSLAADLQSGLAGHDPFELPVKDLMWPLGGLRKATMLWTTFADPDGACERLVSAVEDVAADYGVVPDSRVFNPHVTLVRTRAPRTVPKRDDAVGAMRAILGDIESMSVAGVTVFESTLTKHRAFYRSIGSAPLG
jgi:2'-5' RNA ligase